MPNNFLSFLGMLTVLVVILICAYYTTRWMATRMSQAPGAVSSGQKLTMVHRLLLGRDQQLMVVKVANRHVVIGCTPTQISFITELTEEESDEFFPATPEGTVNQMMNFTDVLQALRAKKTAKDENDSGKD